MYVHVYIYVYAYAYIRAYAHAYILKKFMNYFFFQLIIKQFTLKISCKFVNTANNTAKTRLFPDPFDNSLTVSLSLPVYEYYIYIYTHTHIHTHIHTYS